MSYESARLSLLLIEKLDFITQSVWTRQQSKVFCMLCLHGGMWEQFYIRIQDQRNTNTRVIVLFKSIILKPSSLR